MRKAWIVGLLALFSGCAELREKIPLFGQVTPRVGGVYHENFDPERVVDLSIVRKQTGEKRFGIFPKSMPYLEGYLRGIVVDYDDNPIQGVIVRVIAKDRDLPGYDPGISDANGIYRIRFSHPMRKGRVDVQGTLSYNPGWEQQYDMTGAALEPQTKENDFRLYYDQDSGVVSMGESMPKTIVRKATGVSKSYKKSKKGEQQKIPAPAPPPGASSPKKQDDFFGGFGEFERP
jgi:hypothetical protein